MDAQLRALAEPRRREILRLVWSHELPAGAIAARFDVTRPAISQHLTVLKAAGLIAERRVGTRRLYRARQEQLAELLAGLQTFWDDKLAALKQAAEAEEREERERDDRLTIAVAGGEPGPDPMATQMQASVSASDG